MVDAPFLLRNVRSDERARWIAQVQNRLLIYAPGLSSLEISALQQIQPLLAPDHVHLYVDVSEQSFQAGYWHGQAAAALAGLVAGFTLRNTAQVRLGLLIADNRALIFTPPLPRVEEEPDGMEANAVQLSAEMTELLWRSIVVQAIHSDEVEKLSSGIGKNELEKSMKIPDRSIVDQNTLDRISGRQEILPPIQPQQERLLSTLREQLKLVRLQVEGFKFQNRTLALPKEIVEILGSDNNQVNEYLRASWRIFTESVDKEISSLQLRLNQQVETIRKTYLKPLGHFGSGILTKQMPNYRRDLSFLEATLDEIRAYVRIHMPAYLTESRKKLVFLLLEHAESRHLTLPQPQLNFFDAPTDLDQQRRSAEWLVDKVDWPSVEELVSNVQIHSSIDDMTMDHLSQPSFIKAAEKAYRIDLTKAISDISKMGSYR